MAYFRGDVASQALGMNTGWNAILPEDLPHDDLQVVYLLHGLSDNCSSWVRMTGLERYARRYRAAVIIPEVQRSYYADMAYGPAYFSYVSDELPRLAHTLFGLPADRAHCFAMGLSMGGYGALKCALTYPERYAGAASFSGAIDMAGLVGRNPPGARIHQEFIGIVGESRRVGSKSDLFALARKAASVADKPRLFLTCGIRDGLLEQNRAMAGLLRQEGFDPAYHEWDGGHEWNFWDRSLELAFEYFLEIRE